MTSSRPFPPSFDSQKAFQDFLAELFRPFPQGVLIVGLSNNLLFINPKMSELMGLPHQHDITLDDFRKDSFANMVDSEKFSARVKENYEGRESVNEENVFLKSGVVLSRTTSPFILNDSYLGQLWLYHDVTENHLINALNQTIIQYSPIGIALATKEGTFTQVNHAWANILGYTQEELLGTNFSHYTYPDDMTDSKSVVQKLLSGEIETAKVEKRYVHKSGSIISALIQLTKIPPHNESDAVFLIQINDFTEQKKTERALLQAQKIESIGVLAGGIAHDFNNLLVALKSQNAVVLKKLEQGLDPQIHVLKIEQITKNASYLTEQLLAYSGQKQFKVEHIDLNAEIEKSMGILKLAIPKNISLEPQLSTIKSVISAEKAQIQQVLLNLIINAAESMENQAGTIRVHTDEVDVHSLPDAENSRYILAPQVKGQHIQIAVSDTGSGMTSETIGKIFDPFFTTKFTGRGLGLAAVLGIIRSHQGALKIKSQLNVGTTFTLLFPIIESDLQVQTSSQPAIDSTGDANPISQNAVLLIDDDEFLRDSLIDLFDLENINLICAVDGQDGINKLKENQATVSLVLLDLSMPGISSIDTFTALKELKPDLPVILCSGYSQSNVQDAFVGEDVEAFFSKPFAIESLLSRVREFLT